MDSITAGIAQTEQHFMYSLFEFSPAETGQNLKKACPLTNGPVVFLPSVHHFLQWWTAAGALSLRLEVINMITIDGATYCQCGHCLNWFAVECMGWDNELLTWACSPACTSW